LRYFEKKRLGNSEPFRPGRGGWGVAGEAEIHRHEGLVKPVKMDDCGTGEGGNTLEIERAVVNLLRAFPGHEKGQAVGPADQRAGCIEAAAALLQEGAWIDGEGGGGTLPNSLAFGERQFTQCRRQCNRFNGEERQVPAAAVTTGATGDHGTKLLFDSPAEVIHSGDELAIVFQPGGKEGESVFNSVFGHDVTIRRTTCSRSCSW
jgi:hypothetical protein